MDRRSETEYLRDRFGTDKFEFIPIWGRRRVGKTQTILESLDGKGVYFLATESNEAINIANLKSDASGSLNDPSILDLKDDWEAVLKNLGARDIPIVIDEFPYLVVSNKAIPSVFQRIVDLHLSKTRSKLILCGSSIKMMEDHVLGFNSPLYGRRTGQMKIEPIPFKYVKEFCPGYGTIDQVRVFGCCGGIPLYLNQIDTKCAFWTNLSDRFLDPRSLLYQEADLLLKAEFGKRTVYSSILREVSSGRTQLDRLKKALNMPGSDLTAYLSNLISVGIVRRIVPVTEDEARSRRGQYVISDNFFRFHYRFMFPNLSMLEAGDKEPVLKRIRKDYDRYLGPIFERIATEAFREWSRSKGRSWDRIGPWWHDEDEIDLVALSEERKEMMVGEVKWTSSPTDVDVVKDLIRKSESVRFGTEDRKIGYLIVSRSGFTERALDLMEEEGILYWDLDNTIGTGSSEAPSR